MRIEGQALQDATRWTYIVAGIASLLLAALTLGIGLLRASLPRLEGASGEPGLTSVVRITRDSRGVPTIEAANRLDLAYATGFVHAQDRYFEMDLSRRLAAGELAAGLGNGQPGAQPADRAERAADRYDVAWTAQRQGADLGSI